MIEAEGGAGSSRDGAVVWFTGLPSSGKSSMAAEVARALERAGARSCLLDGDDVRAALVPPPGYAPEERRRFYQTLAGLAALLACQGLAVLVPATAHERAHRARARELAPRFVEVFLDVPVEVCARRDPRGLYARARAGEIESFPGVQVAYEPPERPDVTARGAGDLDAVERIVAAVLAGRRETTRGEEGRA